jgi:hypothetical protein
VRKIALRGGTIWQGAGAILRTLSALRISVRFKWPAGVSRTINLPQAFDMLEKDFARPISKHNREKEYPALHVWTPISRHRWIMA